MNLSGAVALVSPRKLLSLCLCSLVILFCNPVIYSCIPLIWCTVFLVAHSPVTAHTTTTTNVTQQQVRIPELVSKVHEEQITHL